MLLFSCLLNQYAVSLCKLVLLQLVLLVSVYCSTNFSNFSSTVAHADLHNAPYWQTSCRQIKNTEHIQGWGRPSVLYHHQHQYGETHSDSHKRDMQRSIQFYDHWLGLSSKGIQRRKERRGEITIDFIPCESSRCFSAVEKRLYLSISDVCIKSAVLSQPGNPQAQTLNIHNKIQIYCNNTFTAEQELDNIHFLAFDPRYKNTFTFTRDNNDYVFCTQELTVKLSSENSSESDDSFWVLF